MILQSKVKGHEGKCTPIWLNNNAVDVRISTGGLAGFFRNVRKHWLLGWIKYGKEFHGMITTDGVISTEGLQS